MILLSRDEQILEKYDSMNLEIKMRKIVMSFFLSAPSHDVVDAGTYDITQ